MGALRAIKVQGEMLVFITLETSNAWIMHVTFLIIWVKLLINALGVFTQVNVFTRNVNVCAEKKKMFPKAQQIMNKPHTEKLHERNWKLFNALFTGIHLCAKLYIISSNPAWQTHLVYLGQTYNCVPYVELRETLSFPLKSEGWSTALTYWSLWQ